MNTAFNTVGYIATGEKALARHFAGQGPKNLSDWFRIERRNLGPDGTVNDAPTSADIYLFDEIGFWGTMAKDVAEQVNALDVETLTVHINSPGGLVFDGLAIYNLFKQHKARVVVQIESLAASIASIIAMAGDEVRMAENALLMIHDPLSVVVGRAADMRKEADVLDNIKTALVTTYQAKVGDKLTAKQISKMMTDETWIDAQTAKTQGFIDTVTKGSDAKNALARFDLSDFQRAPERLNTAPAAGPTPEAHTTASRRRRLQLLSLQQPA